MRFSSACRPREAAMVGPGDWMCDCPASNVCAGTVYHCTCTHVSPHKRRAVAAPVFASAALVLRAAAAALIVTALLRASVRAGGAGAGGPGAPPARVLVRAALCAQCCP